MAHVAFKRLTGPRPSSAPGNDHLGFDEAEKSFIWANSRIDVLGVL
jgi:hypothetical protein